MNGENLSVKRPDGPVAPEQKSGSKPPSCRYFKKASAFGDSERHNANNRKMLYFAGIKFSDIGLPP
jgi:hypothetical protein